MNTPNLPLFCRQLQLTVRKKQSVFCFNIIRQLKLTAKEGLDGGL